MTVTNTRFKKKISMCRRVKFERSAEFPDMEKQLHKKFQVAMQRNESERMVVQDQSQTNSII